MSDPATLIATQAGFLQGEITDTLLPGTPAEVFPLAQGLAITGGPVCRWLSKLFTCSAACRPITRDPTDCPKNPVP
jgi:hypothetical protein